MNVKSCQSLSRASSNFSFVSSFSPVMPYLLAMTYIWVLICARFPCSNVFEFFGMEEVQHSFMLSSCLKISSWLSVQVISKGSMLSHLHSSLHIGNATSSQQLTDHHCEGWLFARRLPINDEQETQIHNKTYILEMVHPGPYKKTLTEDRWYSNGLWRSLTRKLMWDQRMNRFWEYWNVY